MEKLKGPFYKIIPSFQKYKKSMGYKYNNIEAFYRLDKTLAKNDITTLDDTKIIFDILVTNESNFSKKKEHYNCLKQLYKYMKNDNNKNFYFEYYSFKTESNFIPTILNKKQVELLFKIIDNLSSTLELDYRYIFPVLFRLIYSCGLRISEVISLKYTDFARENGTITIYKSKNKTTRILPLSNSMLAIMIKYDDIINDNSRNYFFEVNHRECEYKIISSFFKLVKKNMNILNLRIHDIRHTFASTTYHLLCKKGYSEKHILTLLYIYMGHKNIKSTEYYIKFTDEYYDCIFQKLKNNDAYIIPKVGDRR